MGVALAAQFIGSNLRFLAALLQRLQTRNVKNETAATQLPCNGVWIGTEKLGIDHE
jgi:hypothetical protein